MTGLVANQFNRYLWLCSRLTEVIRMLTNNSDLIHQRMTDEPMSSSQTRITTSVIKLLQSNQWLSLMISHWSTIKFETSKSHNRTLTQKTTVAARHMWTVAMLKVLELFIDKAVLNHECLSLTFWLSLLLLLIDYWSLSVIVTQHDGI